MTRTGRRRYVAPALLITGGSLVLGVGATHVHRPAPRTLPASFGQVGPAAPSPGRPSARLPRPTAMPSATTAAPRAAAVPTRVLVPRLGIDARVVPTGSAGAAIVVPTRVSTVGWWVTGSAPGATTGTTVLVGHVDSAAAGPGALFRLDRLRPGDLVEVGAGAGPPWRYRVTALRTVPKSTGLAGFAFDATSSPRLAVITCGGPFDARTKSYADNIVVFASPAGP